MPIDVEPGSQELAAAIEVLFKEARRRRRRRWLAAGGLTAVLVAGACLAVGSTHSGGASGGVLPWAGSSSDPAAAAALYQAPARVAAMTAMLDEFLPANGAQFAAGREFGEYVTVARISVTNRCLAKEGMPVEPVRTQSYSGANVEFPYVPYLATHGSVTAPTTTGGASVTAGMSAAAAKAFSQAEHRCAAPVVAELAPVFTQGAALQTAWMRVVAQIDRSPAFSSELRRFSSCLAAHGIHAASVTAFFSVATAKAHRAGGSSTAARGIGQLYARRVAPLEAARDRARAEARSSFTGTNSGAVAALESSWQAVLIRFERAGIEWPSP